MMIIIIVSKICVNIEKYESGSGTLNENILTTKSNINWNSGKLL